MSIKKWIDNLIVSAINRASPIEMMVEARVKELVETRVSELTLREISRAVQSAVREDYDLDNIVSGAVVDLDWSDHLDYSELAKEIDLTDLAGELQYDDLAGNLDYSELADELKSALTIECSF